MSLATKLLLPVRGVQFVFSLVVMAMMADAIVHLWDPPNEVGIDFGLLIVSVWSLVVIIWLVITPILVPKVANKYAILVLDIITMLFWIGLVAALAEFTVDLCHNNSFRGKKCDEFTVAVVFGSFTWALFVSTSTMAAMHCWRTRGSRSEPSQQVYTEA